MSLDAPDTAKDAATTEALVIFTPSGKRGHFPIGTPVLTAARQLGVDLDSVCGGRGICSKCQITPGYGEFPKHGLTVASDALSDWNSVEDRYKRIRGHDRRPPSGLSGAGAWRCCHRRAARKPGSQTGHPQIRDRAEDRHGSRHPRLLRRGAGTRHARAHRRFRAVEKRAVPAMADHRGRG